MGGARMGGGGVARIPPPPPNASHSPPPPSPEGGKSEVSQTVGGGEQAFEEGERKAGGSSEGEGMQNEIMWLSSNSQIQTNIVEKSGWRSLISFGSIFPSTIKTFPKQMFALGKELLENFPFRQAKKGSALFTLPFEGSLINW